MRSRPMVMAFGSTVLLAGLVYLNALDNPFVYDDRRLIVENMSPGGTAPLGIVVSRDLTRPIVALSYAADRAVWGPGPFGFHLTNVLLHMVNAGLLFLLVSRVLKDRPASAGAGPDDAWSGRVLVVASIAGLVFAVHPMMTQAVGYVSGRAEVLAAACLLAALHAARAWFVSGRARCLAATFVLWLAAIASKETAVVFPVALLAFDWLVFRPDAAERRWRLFWLHVPLFTFALVGGFLRLVVLAFVEHPGSVGIEPAFVPLQLDVLRRYVGLLILPRGQTIFHEIAPLGGAGDPRLALGAGLVGAIGLAVWKTRRRAPLAAFGLLWFVLLLVPSMVLVVLDRGELLAEQRVYGAAAGLFVAVGCLAGWMALALRRTSRVARWVSAAGAVVLVASLSARTVLRNAVWADPVTLWTEAVSYAPDHWVPNLALGEALAEAGRHEEAVARFLIAISENPDEPAAYSKLGISLLETRSYDQAMAAFEELRRRDPDSNEAANGLGAVALVTGRPDEAREYYLETLERDRWNIAAHKALAAMDEATDPASALWHCEQIAEVWPGAPGIDECISRNRARVDAAAGGTGSGG